MPSTSDAAASVATRVDELGMSVRDLHAGELRALMSSISERRMQEREVPESISLALAVSREALRRAVGVFVDAPVVGAVAEALAGAVPKVPDQRRRNAATAMALHWYSLAGKGAHFVSWDERRAREAIAFFEPVGALLGCEARLVTESMAGAVRSQAYGASVTFGTCSGMAADYLRDNLQDLRTNVVQRELHAAVMDDVNHGLVERALSQVVITAPGAGNVRRSRDADVIAGSFRPGIDYRVDRKRQAIMFSTSAVAQIRSAIGWEDAPLFRAVTVAERIEDIIVHREGLGRPDEREIAAEISIQGYLAAYESLAGFSSKGRPAESVDRILQEQREAIPNLRELTFERLIDRQRAKIYSVREAVRDSPDTLSLLRPIVIDVAQPWMAAGPAALIKEMQDLIAGWQTPEQIDGLLAARSSQADALDRAVLLVEEVVERRTGQLDGRIEAAAFFRRVLLTVIDLQWSSHIARMRFIQRQSDALYHHAKDLDEARNADGECLFAACEQAVRVDSIKYLLNAHP
jgi:preprotein translocase subunit SecA